VFPEESLVERARARLSVVPSALSAAALKYLALKEVQR